MCGRYNLITDADALIDAFGLTIVFVDDTPFIRYNIAPSQLILAIRAGDKGRALVRLRWGLLPFWSNTDKPHYSMINAMAETVASKPAYRAAFKRRRCLIPATGFYEWAKKASGKQPYNITLEGRALFAFAGIWERWEGKEGQTIESCAIITTASNSLVTPIHNRMPVVLPPDAYALWLDAAATRDELVSLLVPYAAGMMEACPVSTAVNNARNEGSELISRID